MSGDWKSSVTRSSSNRRLDFRESRQLLWFDRTGRVLDAVGTPADYSNVDLSRDGRRVVADRTDPQTGNHDIWLFDLSRGASTRFTFHPAVDLGGVWSPDGRRIAFASSREGTYNLYQKHASGAGEEELLLKTAATKAPTGWSSDGRLLLYKELDPQRKWNLWVLTLEGRQAEPWLRTEFEERNGRFSPDGRWVAYESNESGRYEIHVRPFSPRATEGAGTVSTGGGIEPRWRGDGKELFYLAPDRRLMAVGVKSAGDRLEAGIPRALFPTHW